MNVQQMHLRVLQQLQNHISQDLDIRSIDAEYFLNRGMDLWVDGIYDKYKGQEELKKRLASVLQTVTAGSPLVGTGIHGGSLWELEENVRYVIDESVNDATVPVKPVDSVYYNKQKDNPYKKPSSNLVWRMDAERESDTGYAVHELITKDGFVITNYQYTYIETPERMDLHSDTTVDCVIADAWHDEIVDKAVEVALQTYRIAGSLRTKPE